MLKGLHQAKFFLFSKPFFTYQPHPCGSISLHHDPSLRLSHVSTSAPAVVSLMRPPPTLPPPPPPKRSQRVDGSGGERAAGPKLPARWSPGVSRGRRGCCGSSAGTQRQAELNRTWGPRRPESRHGCGVMRKGSLDMQSEILPSNPDSAHCQLCDSGQMP